GAEEGLPGLMVLRALGGGLQIEYSHDGIATSAVATVGQDVKTLTVEVAAMIKENGNWCVEHQRVTDDIRMMNERYAQANIKVVWDGELNHFFAPPSVATNMAGWFTCTETITGFVMTAESRDVIDASGLSADNMRVIYVPEWIRGEAFLGDELVQGEADGVAFATNIFSNALDRAYIDTCFISSLSTTNTVPPHEVTHLFEVGHEDDLWNLMYENTTSADDPRGSKRLTQKQVDKIRSKGIERNKLK
ncbi:MAG: hypothetical protein FWG50_11660, partial [Kiritimatiellaeota bacterium]|nr:hypothetical protein [Kiritimatiellota bacterium]